MHRPHPLDPLSGDEIAAASAIVIREKGRNTALRFVSIELNEPPKRSALGLDGQHRPDREAFIVLRDRQNAATIEAVVSLARDEVRSWRAVPGAQCAFVNDELAECDAAIRADPRYREALGRRGLTDPSQIEIDFWATGNAGPQDDPERRLLRALTFVRTSKFDNFYAHPVEGLLVVVDLDRMTVVEVADHGVVETPERPGNYIPELMAGEVGGHVGNVPAFHGVREDLRPIVITQPEGPSFTVQGHAVAWQKWRLRIGYTPREGLVLHEIGYEDAGRLRPILHRASLAELYVTYGDPNPTHLVKNVFDEGEWGIGALLNYLQPGCDCLGEIRYFDVIINDANGKPFTLPNAICMHEEDIGVGWKHTDGMVGHVETRRSRRLVLSSFFTANNYEYGFFWYLYVDGTIQFEVKLTGILSTGAFPPGSPPRFGTVLAPGLYAPYHQHFFNVRLDMCVDGERNSVYEVDSVAMPPGSDNPDASAWTTRETLLAAEGQAQRLVDPLAARYWAIVNPAVRNTLGQPVAYKLVPGENVLPLAGEGSQTHRRAGFAYRHLWVTAYDPSQRYAAGDYPNQRPDGDGLPVYARADRPLVDTDVVLWYSFGAHHVPRPEDWPVMPVSCVGFQLRPLGFFDGNPAVDLLRPPHGDHGQGG